MSGPQPIQASQLQSAEAPVAHGFFTREGGVSTGIYEGLNVGLGSKDERDHVNENRARVAAFFDLGTDQLVTAYQIHSNKTLVVEGPLNGERPQVDGLVTNRGGVALGVLTADCGPVLFCDAQNHVVGAAHAGWKGATGGVLENTVRQMESLGASRKTIQAVLGPTISQQNYEVGPEFAANLLALDRQNADYLIPSIKKDHHMFDLPSYIVNRLQKFGVTAAWTGHCTYSSEEHFFSYRRTTHRAESDYGRQIAVIGLRT